VPIEVTGVAPGTEYLLKVNNREVKEGIADSDKVSRKFRMPNLGDKRREARLVMVLANEGCENSPWKLKQKMGYRPPEPPPVTAEPTPPVTQPQPTPTPPAAQTPTPSITTPSPKPVTPKLTTPVKPIVPKQPTTVNPLEPAPDAKAWVTPIDPYSRLAEKAPQPPASTDPSDRSTEQANSTAALIGLVGLFVLLGGLSAVAWTRFRRYDDEQLSALLNPDGKLPSMLDASAVDLGAGGMVGAHSKSKDMAGGLGVGGSRQMGNAAAAAAAAGTVVAAPGDVKESSAPAAEPVPVAEPAPVAAAEPAIETPTIPAALIKAPVVPPAVGAPVNGTHVANGAQAPDVAEPPTPVVEQPPVEQPPVAEPPAPVVEQPPAVEQPPVTEPEPAVAHAPNGADTRSPSYRGEVETELQRILREAGVDTELENILTDARAEADRQGVAMDSGIMLRALTGETEGAANLSDRAKGELEHRFERIAAEERSQTRPAGDE
jgi:hypothetical protein